MMELTGLELTMSGVALTALGGWLASWRGQSKTDCAKCQSECRAAVQAQLDRIAREQDELAGEVARKIDILFRMVRSLIIHSEIPKDEQDRILNDRGL